MNCAWQAYLNLLPAGMRDKVDKVGKCDLQELRLRIGRQPKLIMSNGQIQLNNVVDAADLAYCINAVSNYSPWSSTTIRKGFLTAAGGHRIGICGETAIVDGKISTIKNITSICIRVARDILEIGKEISELDGSTIIIGAPGNGKSTLLRDVIRQKSKFESVGIVDERMELFPISKGSFCFFTGDATDILSGCSKREGMQMLLRTMTPTWIAVDEITERDDCMGLLHAAWCGVGLLATAHASCLDDFMSRSVYKPLVDQRIFRNIIVMKQDKTWTLERMNK